MTHACLISWRPIINLPRARSSSGYFKRRMATRTVSLTPPESLFRRCLLDCREEMSALPGMKDLELRFTGGWVRDKLLGVQSHDIDVALSTMTGEQFGLALQQFMKGHGEKYVNEAKSSGIDHNIKDLHKIAKNPEKSKHLETITTKMFGIDVDFVNLRKEVYDELSRNPQIEFGTPEEDAMRRDATVNALFYNVHTQQVEDFTQQGLVDMKQKIIRTPLEPYKTFRDDPLRVLRLIRFASRLNYEIDSQALDAMRDRSIHEALRVKISRERVGVEVGKIMVGPDAYRGLMYIYDRDLFGPVFANPASDQYPDASSIPKIYKNLASILENSSALCLGLRPKDALDLTWTLATYVPWRHSDIEAVSAARESIRATNTVSKVLGDAVRYRTDLVGIVEAAQVGTATRSRVGMTLRNAGSSWRFMVLYALLCDTLEGELSSVADKYQAFLNYLQDQELTEAATLKPIINGNEVKVALGIKAGPWLKEVLEKLVEWQFENPAATANDAKAMLANRKEEFKLG